MKVGPSESVCWNRLRDSPVTWLVVATAVFLGAVLLVTFLCRLTLPTSALLIGATPPFVTTLFRVNRANALTMLLLLSVFPLFFLTYHFRAVPFVVSAGSTVIGMLVVWRCFLCGGPGRAGHLPDSIK